MAGHELFYKNAVGGEIVSPRRAAVIHDLSGVGRCALTVVIPTLAAMGVQPCPAPTAVLSTHTGGYENWAAQDLTRLLPAYFGHWQSLGLVFDAVYSGYIPNEAQQHAIADFMKDQRARGCRLIVVDPVMGDMGELYSGLGERIRDAMRTLSGYADIITPNLTEAALLLDIPYRDSPHTDGEIYALLQALCRLTPCVVLTSMPCIDGTLANVAMRRGDKGFWRSGFQRVDAQFPGTGDLLTTVLTGALIEGHALPYALSQATGFVLEAVRQTHRLGTPEREGVALESLLGRLLRPGKIADADWVSL